MSLRSNARGILYSIIILYADDYFKIAFRSSSYDNVERVVIFKLLIFIFICIYFYSAFTVHISKCLVSKSNVFNYFFKHLWMKFWPFDECLIDLLFSRSFLGKGHSSFVKVFDILPRISFWWVFLSSTSTRDWNQFYMYCIYIFFNNYRYPAIMVVKQERLVLFFNNYIYNPGDSLA